MKAFLDTSVLVAAFYDDHMRHEPSFALLWSLRSPTGCTAAHCFAEFYSTTTRMPGKRQASPHNVLQFLEQVRERLTPVVLDDSDYAAVLDDSAQIGIVGGAIYDALIAKCAVKANARTIYTWNTKHFMRLGGDIAARVREPGTA